MSRLQLLNLCAWLARAGSTAGLAQKKGGKALEPAKGKEVAARS